MSGLAPREQQPYNVKAVAIYVVAGSVLAAIGEKAFKAVRHAKPQMAETSTQALLTLNKQRCMPTLPYPDRSFFLLPNEPMSFSHCP